MSTDSTPTVWYKDWGKIRELLAWSLNVIQFAAMLAWWMRGGMVGPPPVVPVIPDQPGIVQSALVISEDAPNYERELERANAGGRPVYYTGWVPNPDELVAIKQTLPTIYFADTPAGKVPMDAESPAYLWQAAAKARAPPLEPRDQGKLGSCTAFGAGNAIDVLQLVQIADGARKDYFPVVNEALYGMGRVDIGKPKVRSLPREGAMASWVVMAAQQEGTLARKAYDGYDLSHYSVDLCRKWGNQGVPSALKDEARKHVVKQFTFCRTSAEMIKALQQGFPLDYGGPIGVGQRRDANGIARWDRTWGHSMAILGYDPKIDAFFFWNSWGNSYHTGPKGPGDPPDGGFWLKRSDMDRCLRLGASEGVEVIALSDAVGFPARRKVKDWIARRPGQRLEMPFALAP